VRGRLPAALQGRTIPMGKFLEQSINDIVKVKKQRSL